MRGKKKSKAEEREKQEAGRTQEGKKGSRNEKGEARRIEGGKA